MNQRSEDAVSYLPAEAGERRSGLAAAHRDRVRRQDSFTVAEPEKAAADRTTLFGAKKYSPQASQHNQRIDAIKYAEDETEYALLLGLRLEYLSVQEASRTVAAEEDIYRSCAPNSLESVITQELVLDSVDHIRTMSTRASEGYMRKAFQ